jgi:hypothetical protein
MYDLVPNLILVICPDQGWDNWQKFHLGTDAAKIETVQGQKPVAPPPTA